MGTMKLAAAEGRDLLFVAGGTGLSLLKAIAEQAVKAPDRHPGRRMSMFYGAAAASGDYRIDASAFGISGQKERVPAAMRWSILV